MNKSTDDILNDFAEACADPYGRDTCDAIRRHFADQSAEIDRLTGLLNRGLVMVDGKVYDHRDVFKMRETIDKLPVTADGVPDAAESEG